jgi:DNA-binding NarL/FixJ family response regulator
MALSILFIGDTDRAQFREAPQAARRLGDLLEVADAAAAADALASGRTTPDLIVVAQAFPGEFSAASIERLLRLAPLARVVGLLGSWCEGETRTGKPWPAAIRVYWHQWLPRADEELRRLGSGQTSSWSLPITASEEERLLATADQPWEKRQGRVAIRSPWAETYAWLADACRLRGYTPLRLSAAAAEGAPIAAADALVFDGTDCAGRELTELSRLAATVRPAPVVVLLDFPRVEDRDRALAAGAAAVLGKPLLLEDLLWQLDAVWPASCSSRSA